MTTEPRPVPPIAAGTLAKRLRAATPAIIAALGGTPPKQEWRFETRDEMFREWNGGETGPLTHESWTLEAGDAEAVVRLDTIRWSPFEVHRMEVSGHWKAGGQSASLFARGEGEAMIVEVWAEDVVWGVASREV